MSFVFLWKMRGIHSSEPETMLETIVINGKFLASPVTGVQRYALEILNQMDRQLAEPVNQNLRMVCLVPKMVKSYPNWQSIQCQQVGFGPANFWEQFELPLYASGRLIFSPANTGPVFYSKQVVTFHDANIFAFPEAYSFLFRLKYKFIFNILARIAKLVLTDSQFSQRELARYLRLPLDRFHVILLGGNHLDEIKADEKILEKNGLDPQTYLLCVASQSRHKNFQAVLMAAEILKTDVKFAVDGASNRIFQNPGELPKNSNLKMLGYVDSQELKALYKNALGFLFPSLYEGFGLPILEAMACGCPVLCSSAASMPEVGGQAVVYFNPRDLHNMVNEIRRFVSDFELRMDLRARGYAQVDGFHWEQAARLTLVKLANSLQKGNQ